MTDLHRRRFLQWSAAATAGFTLASCSRRLGSNPTASSGASPGKAATDKLLIYTWADYSDRSIYDRFSQQAGIPLTADVYDSNETMLAKLQAGGGAGYSVIYPTDYMVTQMRDLNLLTPIDKTKLKGLENLLDRWQNPTYDPQNAHSIPLSWGTTGLVYNKKALGVEIKDWEDLWTHKDKLQGKMVLLDDMRETLGATLKSLGHSYNSRDPKQIQAAADKLRELKPAIANFQSFGWDEQIMAGDLLLAMTYSGTANNLTPKNADLDYCIPASGTSLWTDTLVIPKTAPNPDAAYAWVNFLLDPANVVTMLEKLKFAPANKAAIALLPTALTSNLKMFPPQTLVDKCEALAAIGDATQIFEKAWTELKSA